MPKRRSSGCPRVPFLLLRICLVVALAWVVGNAGCVGSGLVTTAGPTNPPANPPPPTPPGVNVFVCDTPNANCSSASAFSIAALRDLNIFVRWSHVPAGNHLQTIRIVSPYGNTYQTFETSFLVTDSAQGPITNLQTLPVAGTWIRQRSLVGNWTIEVDLDGQLMASQAVQLNP